jgi:dipeptidyl aminopeptidase/acylaminoacyl peptidase
MVYEFIMADEVLRDQKEVDSERIAMLGISYGGRFAINRNSP